MSGYGSKIMESIRLYVQVPWYNIRCILGVSRSHSHYSSSPAGGSRLQKHSVNYFIARLIVYGLAMLSRSVRLLISSEANHKGSRSSSTVAILSNSMAPMPWNETTIATNRWQGALGPSNSAVAVRHSYGYSDIAFSLTGIIFIQPAPESYD